MEIAKDCRRRYPLSQRPCVRISLFVLETICLRASALLESSPDRFPDGNTDYQDTIDTILKPALVGVLRAANDNADDQYIAVEELVKAYIRANEV